MKRGAARPRLRVVEVNRTGVRLPGTFGDPMAAALLRGPFRKRALVSLVVVGDGEMRRLNRRYLGERGSTDVLSFPDGERDNETGLVRLGEIVINRDRAAAVAGRRTERLRAEMALYAVHGMLHLLGYRDDTEAGRRRMEAEQTRILAGWRRRGPGRRGER